MGIGESKILNINSNLFVNLPYQNILKKNKHNIKMSLSIPIIEISVNKLDKSTINEINKNSHLLASDIYYDNFIFYLIIPEQYRKDWILEIINS